MNSAALKIKTIKNLKSIPFDVGNIHLVGIGGIGMSGIAEILHNMGYKVSGSDLSENYNVKRLRKMGIEIRNGHVAENVHDCSVVVRSSAVSFANPEILEARKLNIPVVKRSEMLAELTKLKATIAISGTHGKTTTTSLIAHIFDVTGHEPTVINGGIINTYGSNAKLGSGDWLVAEADESDGTFIQIPATIGVVTNIDPEHLDYWKDFASLQSAFRDFLRNLPFYGFGVLNIDHPNVRSLLKDIQDRRIYRYSMEEGSGADVYAKNIRAEDGKSIYTCVIAENLSGTGKVEEAEFELPCFGMHNISNSLAAIIVALGVGITIPELQKAVSSFKGVKRRFTITGNALGATIVDDYAHHPVEINATLDAAKHFLKGKKGRVIAVMQPHRYTRLENLFNDFAECFSNADEVIITQMYSAGEDEIEGVNQHTLANAVKNNGKSVIALDDDKTLPSKLKEIIKDGDIVVCMGAGTITYYAANLPAELEALK